MHDFTYQVAEDLPIFTALMLWTKYHPLILILDLSLFPDTVFLAFFPRLVAAFLPLCLSVFSCCCSLFFSLAAYFLVVSSDAVAADPVLARSLVGQCTTPTHSAPPLGLDLLRFLKSYLKIK